MGGRRTGEGGESRKGEGNLREGKEGSRGSREVQGMQMGKEARERGRDGGRRSGGRRRNRRMSRSRNPVVRREVVRNR